MLRKLVGLALFGCAVIAGLAIGLNTARIEPIGPDTHHAGGFFPMSVPAFAQGTSSKEFPASEVGICAYIKAEQAIDLSRSETVFKGVEAEEEGYAIGYVEMPGLAEDMWPHVYISNDGWIMAYYPKSEPTSRIVQWVGYQRDKITTTTLRDTLVTVSQKMGLSTAAVDSSMSYYHFQYPDATKLLIAVDTAAGTDTFTYTIPLSLNLYEASWSHHAESARNYGGGSRTKIDSQQVYAAGSGTYTACGGLDAQYTSPDAPHVVEVYCDGGWGGAAVVFLHQ